MQHTQKPPVSETGWITCFGNECKTHIERLPACSSATEVQLAAQLQSRVCQRVTRVVPPDCEHRLSTYTDTTESLTRSIRDRTVLVVKV